MPSLLDQIEQNIVEHEARSLTQGFVDSGDLTPDDQEILVSAAWIAITLGLALYARAALNPR